jgi:hypothetical protein
MTECSILGILAVAIILFLARLRYMAQAMPYEGFRLYRGRLKIDLNIRSKNSGRELMDWG